MVDIPKAGFGNTNDDPEAATSKDRVKCNRDILNRFLLTSDPFLSSTRKQPHKKSKPFCSDTTNLLLTEVGNEQTECSEEQTKDLILTNNFSIF